jgi:two-component system LytT family sensor kinase
MKKSIKFYVWLSLAFLALRLYHLFITNPDTFFIRSVNTVWLVSYLLVVNYFLFEYSIRYIKLSWQRIIPGLALIFLYFILYSLGLYFWRFIGIQVDIYSEIVKYPSVEEGVTTILPMSVSSFLFFGIIIHIYDYQKLKKATQQLRMQKQEAELNYLKSQTNPHFLFNTLNNIYSLTREKSDLAPESVMRLSKILRYMLYDAAGEYISIEQELKVIDDYIALEQLRYDDTLRVNFNYNIEDMKQSLPPLLLMPLVENAFKHGVSETRSNPFVDIHLSLQKRQLEFVIRNSSENTIEDKVKENIGLSNLRRQLELLYSEYELTTGYDGNGFRSTLKVNLASNVKN